MASSPLPSGLVAQISNISNLMYRSASSLQIACLHQCVKFAGHAADWKSIGNPRYVGCYKYYPL